MSFLIVRVEDIPKTPEAFQQYVRDWFKPQVVLGFVCMMAKTKTNLDHYEKCERGRQPGIAPGHGVDTRSYALGLPGDQSLNDWISANKNIVWSI